MIQDKSSRTLTVGQLIDKLSRLDPSMPVVFMQQDEPLGDMGVRSVEVCEMGRESTFAEGGWGFDVWHDAAWVKDMSGSWKSLDPVQEVVYLDARSPWQPTIDTEIVQKEISQ